jgi:hypothetical protein
MKHRTLYIGIDPGKSGGISAINDRGEIHSADPMPATCHELADLIRDIQNSAESVQAVLERVHSSPQMGVTSAFTFGQGYGRIEATLAALGIPHDLVTPQKWQAELGCMSGGDKNVTKARAMQMFPDCRVTHKIADSLLLAEFCRRERVGKIKLKKD